MKKSFYILILNLLALETFCQDRDPARLTISGSFSELGISPSEEIWVATRAGNTYYSKQLGDSWRIGPFGSFGPGLSNSGMTFERVNFFSEDTLMISGFIQEGGRQDFVFWSGDHGKSWQKVVFGKSSWIDAAFVNSNGKAWMSGSSQLIYYSQDRGKTWKSFDKVEPTGNLRFSTIFFAKDERTGLFGATWNILYKTPDNCKSWEKLPTPLSQAKYQRLSKEERPDIRKIRIFGSYYIVNQQGRVFITKSDSIDWKYLPSVLDFEVTENDELYIVSKTLGAELYNSVFIRTWQSEQSFDECPTAIAVKNNKLFALTSRSIYKLSPDEFACAPLLTNDIPIPEPHTIFRRSRQWF